MQLFAGGVGVFMMICVFILLTFVKPTSKAWQDFLDSLSTKGGNVFVLFTALVLLMAVYIHVIHDGGDATLGPVIHDLVVGFGGALLGALSAGSSRQQMVDRTQSVAPPQPPA
jgi:hypothetical protein